MSPQPPCVIGGRVGFQSAYPLADEYGRFDIVRRLQCRTVAFGVTAAAC